MVWPVPSSVLCRLVAIWLGILYVDKLSIVCDIDNNECDAVDAENNLLFYDYGHWTLAGARHLGRKIVQLQVLLFVR